MQSLASEPSGSPKVETLYEVRITLVNDNKAVAFELAKEYMFPEQLIQNFLNQNVQ